MIGANGDLDRIYSPIHHESSAATPLDIKMSPSSCRVFVFPILPPFLLINEKKGWLGVVDHKK
jgi:hypothetical protein